MSLLVSLTSQARHFILPLIGRKLDGQSISSPSSFLTRRGNPALPPASSDRASIALRTSVGLDLRFRDAWHFRYSFGETITRNTFGDQLSPPEHRIAKNFQSLFGIYFKL